MQEAVGWLSSFVLVLTLSRQVWKQWRVDTSEGVSRWLFLGQIAASLGFTVYSWMVRNWVFVVTNAALLLLGVLGLVIWMHHQGRGRRARLRPTSA